MSITIERMAPHLDDAARARLVELVDEVSTEPGRISTLFPAVGRRVARGPVDPADPDGLRTCRLEDEARRVLLTVAATSWPDGSGPFADEIRQLYRFGDAEEKRAVLRALSDLEVADLGLSIIEDALRTNDLRLIAAAMGPAAARHLDAAAWRQGVLKCLFVGVPLDAVAELDQRADAELVRMVADYANERRAAGRSVPADAWRVLGQEFHDVVTGPNQED